MPEDNFSALYNRLCTEEYFSMLDMEFAFFSARFGNQSALFKLLAALASRQSSERHLCLDFNNPPEDVSEVFSGDMTLIPKELNKSKAVGDGSLLTPLVLDGNRLYLRRHYMNEIIIEQEISLRKNMRIPCVDAVVKEGLSALFPSADDIWQKCAALNALYRNFSVITGGPGTGKTTVVVRVLLLAIYEEMLRTGKRPSAAICAPTGKAAAHMFRSVAGALSALDQESQQSDIIGKIVASAKDALPSEGTTIHRLLGGYGSRTSYNSENRLPWDIVIVDECSMADAALFARLISSVRESARVILLGDACQLSSVDAGSVMGDICDNGLGSPAYSNEYAVLAKMIALVDVPEEKITDNKKLFGAVTHLSKSRRFSSESGIGALARMINNGSGDSALAFLKAGTEGCSFVEMPGGNRANPFLHLSFRNMISGILSKRYADIYGENVSTAVDIANRLRSFQILCAARRGVCGCEAMNEYAEDLIVQSGLLRKSGKIYHGLPLIVTENDHAMKLYNGDTGVLFDSGDGAIRAYFESSGGVLRSVLPLQILSWEQAYALTIHKSQGSEYEHVLIILSPNDSALLSRELLYTAVTRAKKSVTIVSSEDIFISACSRKTKRDSGLNDRLWKDESK
jgi:exodeoxyribonuclease V alpha subunit